MGIRAMRFLFRVLYDFQITIQLNICRDWQNLQRRGGGISRVAYYDGVTLTLSTASDRLSAQAVIGRGPANRQTQ